MQAAVATATIAAGVQPSTETRPVDLVESCPSTAADQNINVVVEMETNHNHHDTDSSYDETLSPPSTLTLRLIMQGKVRRYTTTC